MTARELRHEVSSLCYTDIGEKDIRFIIYANLALRTIYNEFGVISEHKINLGKKPLYYTERILHTGGRTQKLPLVGKSFSMLLSGKGCVTVTDGERELRKIFDSEETAFCGFLSGEATLNIEGDESFTVYNLACFNEDFGGEVSKIRIIKPTVIYSMREVTKNFHSFITAPTDENGFPIAGVKLIDDKLIFDGQAFGIFNLLYKRLPKKILTDFQDEPIDVPESYEDILTLLCTYLFLSEDERERAEYFKNLYSEILQSKKVNVYERIGNDYIDTNGWA